ncbi:MFS transporter [Actinoallomurus iriomotensis]|uniref:MFS transporter n=1 Tax=Actinoallomurus iriomotensis TaxID=478107 RepID=UPI0025525A70|nr:MFS transporter [Actinoallomurus iriomotensis]
MSRRAGPAEDDAGRRSLRPLAGILAALMVSQTGTRISAIALPWFVLVTTGSATRTGLTAFCEMAPYVTVKALAGPLVETAGPRTVSWVADAVSGAVLTLIPLLHALHLLSFWTLSAMVAVIGAARGPGDLAKEVIVPEAAERGRVPLERATGLAGTTDRLASTFGPAAGGALIGLAGALTGLVVVSGCFALGSVAIALGLPRGMGHTPERNAAAGTGYWRRLGEGLVFLREERLLLNLCIVVAVTNLLDAAFSSVLLPVWARQSGAGPAGIGLVGSALGIGAVGGSLVAAAVAHRIPRRPVFFIGFLVAGAPRFLILAAGVPTGAVAAVFAVAGLGAGFLSPILGAISFERVPRRLLGRVRGLTDSLAWAGIPLGGLIGGAAVASVGLVPVLVTGGAAYFLTTNVAGLRPESREMDRSRM